MRGRNLQISSFSPQHIRQDYPQARRGLSPRSSLPPARADQADRSAARLTPAAFPGFSSISRPTKRLSLGKPAGFFHHKKTTVKKTLDVSIWSVGLLHRGGVKVKNKTLRHQVSRAGLGLYYCN